MKKRSEPSRVLSATLPVNPSVTTTSAASCEEVAPLDVARRTAGRARGRQQRVGLLHEGGPLRLLLADRQQGHRRVAHAVARRCE